MKQFKQQQSIMKKVFMVMLAIVMGVTSAVTLQAQEAPAAEAQEEVVDTAAAGGSCSGRHSLCDQAKVHRRWLGMDEPSTHLFDHRLGHRG